MSDIVFVVPSNDNNKNFAPLGTLILTTILRQNGLSVEIFRMPKPEGTDFDDYIRKSTNDILDKKPKIVSFYCRVDAFLPQLRIAEAIKNYDSSIYTVFGGPQADLASEETIQAIPWVDVCCCGEGETTVLPLMTALLNGGNYTDIDGVVTRDPSGNLIVNPRPKLINNLDDTPMIDPSLYLMGDTLNNRKSIEIDVGRGCPFNCTFCSTSKFWERRFRLKSDMRILDEIKFFYNNGIKAFSFSHDLFTADKKRLLKFCDALEDSGIEISWVCSSRIDTIDEEMIMRMKSVGLTAIFFGVETGSKRMQKIIRKNINPDDVKNVVSLCTKHGISPTLSFMYGFPEETEEDICDTMQLIFDTRELGATKFGYHLCSIQQGTQMFDTYHDELVFSNVVSDQASDFGLVENKEFVESHEELFTYFREYKSELRDKLKYFKKYMSIVMYRFPVAKAIYPLYQKSGLINMYYDFCKANCDYLDENSDFDKMYADAPKLIKRYIENTFEGDRRDALLDILRYEFDYLEWSNNKDAKTDTKVYGMNIAKYIKGATVDEIDRKMTVLRFSVEPDNKRKVAILS